MPSKQITRRELLKWTGGAVLGGVALGAGVLTLAQKDPTKADLEIRMGEFYFEVPGKGKNTPIELEANKELLIKFVNEGSLVHEAHFGRKFNSAKRLYDEDLMPGFLGLHLNPKGEAFLHTLISEKLRGEWELGCLIAGHYEGGQKAKLTIK